MIALLDGPYAGKYVRDHDRLAGGSRIAIALSGQTAMYLVRADGVTAEAMEFTYDGWREAQPVGLKD